MTCRLIGNYHGKGFTLYYICYIFNIILVTEVWNKNSYAAFVCNINVRVVSCFPWYRPVTTNTWTIWRTRTRELLFSTRSLRFYQQAHFASNLSFKSRCLEFWIWEKLDWMVQCFCTTSRMKAGWDLVSLNTSKERCISEGNSIKDMW